MTQIYRCRIVLSVQPAACLAADKLTSRQVIEKCIAFYIRRAEFIGDPTLFCGKRCLKTRMPERLDLKRVYEGCIETLSHACCITESELLWLLLPLSFSLKLPVRIATTVMKDHNIELLLHDIEADEAARNRLIEVGGKRQVPCLFVDGAAMYESNDIIAYLSKTFDVDHVDSSEKNNAAPAGGSCTIGGGCSF